MERGQLFLSVTPVRCILFIGRNDFRASKIMIERARAHESRIVTPFVL